jgi:hypothetical protein
MENNSEKMKIIKKISDMIKTYWQERGAPFEDSDGERYKGSIDSKHPRPKLDRLDAKRYLFDTEEEGSTEGGSPQDPTNKNPWEPPDLD